MNNELETSRAELQSLNEELAAVNGELERNVAELESTADDLSNFRPRGAGQAPLPHRSLLSRSPAAKLR